MAIDNKVVDELVKDVKSQEDLSDLLRALKQRGLEAALSGELTNHLGYEKHERSAHRKPNSRNGYRRKRVYSEYGFKRTSK